MLRRILGLPSREAPRVANVVTAQIVFREAKVTFDDGTQVNVSPYFKGDLYMSPEGLRELTISRDGRQLAHFTGRDSVSQSAPDKIVIAEDQDPAVLKEYLFELQRQGKAVAPEMRGALEYAGVQASPAILTLLAISPTTLSNNTLT